MTAPQPPAAPRKFPGKAGLAVTVLVLVGLGAVVIALSQRDRSKATEQRSDHPPSSALRVADAPRAPREMTVQQVADDEPGWWVGELVNVPLPENPDDIRFVKEAIELRRGVQFSLWLPGPSDDRPAFIRKGEEIIPIEYRWTGDALTIEFPQHGSTILAQRGEIGFAFGHYSTGLFGVWTHDPGTGPNRMGFKAWQPASVQWGPNVNPGRGPEPDLIEPFTEIWRFEFSESGLAKGLIRYGPMTWPIAQATSNKDIQDSIANARVMPRDLRYEISASIESSAGATLYLTGSAMIRSADSSRINSIRLSAFDGASVSLLVAKTDHPGSDRFTGILEARGVWSEAFTATRLPPGDDFDLPRLPSGADHAQPISPWNR